MDLTSFSYRIIFSFFIFIAWINLNLGFNLESRLPVIKRGEKDTYFGYSVAEHQTIDRSTNDITSWLLVGAPIGNNLQPETNHSGALYKCPITITDESGCEQVITDGLRSVNSDDLSPPANDELKDGQWMGVTVRSQGPGKKVLVCAHRYVSRGERFEFMLGFGLCYTLSQTLEYDSAWEFCRGRPTKYAHEQYGYCQTGTSGALLDDDTVVIGSPGPYTWRGTAFVVSVSDDYLERDKATYLIPVDKDPPSPVPKYSYLGMSVTGAKLLSDKDTTYIAGAPRAGETGQVILCSKPKNSTSLYLNVDQIIHGEQFASSFGYEVVTADVNGDKIPDLLVGAPFYFDNEKGGAVYVYLNKNHKINPSEKTSLFAGSQESRFGFAIANLGDINRDGFEDVAIGAPYEGAGVVYIYLGSKNGLITEPIQVLSPSSSKPLNGITTFGYSLSGGMDLDRNGYPDLLIGAYASDAVVLLRSRPIIGLVTKIKALDNFYKINASKNGCESDPDAQYPCFSFNACVMLNPEKSKSQLKIDSGLTLNYTLQAEYKKKLSRVWIGVDQKETPSSITNSIKLQYDNKSKKLQHCEDHTVYLKANEKDIQSPITFKLEYTLIQKEPVMPKLGDSLPNIDDYPILDQQEAAKTFEATFLKECGTDDICNSELIIEAALDLPYYDQVKKISKLVLGLHEEITINITAYNNGEPAYLARLFVVLPSSFFYVGPGKKTEGKPVNCNLFNTTLLICDLGNPFKKMNSLSFQLRFNNGLPDDSIPMIKFSLFGNTTSVDDNSTAQKVPPLYAKVVKDAQLTIKGSSTPETVLYGGVVKGESAMEYLDDIGTYVEHRYEVYNEGPWKVRNVSVEIEWPFQVANNKEQGKWLLYLESDPVILPDGLGWCNLNHSVVNPLNKTQRYGISQTQFKGVKVDKLLSQHASSEIDKSHKRVRRDTEMVVRPDISIDKDGRKHKKFRMNCTLGTAKCIKIKCFFPVLDKKVDATIFIKARIWNSTLVEDYSDAENVKISSKAKFVVPLSPSSQEDKKEDIHELYAETIAKIDDLGKHPPDADLWIYIVAIVIGLILLFLLTLILWKLGFFKRNRVEDPTLSGNLEKHKDY